MALQQKHRLKKLNEEILLDGLTDVADSLIANKYSKKDDQTEYILYTDKKQKSDERLVKLSKRLKTTQTDKLEESVTKELRNALLLVGYTNDKIQKVITGMSLKQKSDLTLFSKFFFGRIY